MQEHEVELSVGDVVRIGDHVVTVVDIDNGEVSFRVEEIGFGSLESSESPEFAVRPR